MIPDSVKGNWDDIPDDPPFNMHVVHDIEDARFVVGKSAEYYVQEFLRLYKRAMGNCVVTAIAGRPGSGKSFMLAHLTYMMVKEKKPPGLPIIIRLIGKRYSPTDFIKAVRSSPTWKGAIDAGEEPHGDSDLESVFKKELTIIREQNPETVLCLLVDNVDEYIRLNGDMILAQEDAIEEKHARKEAWKKAMLDLIHPLNSINNLVGVGICTVLSLTTDVLNDFGLEDLSGEKQRSPSIFGEDGSLRRRFFPITESPTSSKLHTFGGMTLSEAEEMVTRNLERWYDLHPGFLREELAECKSDGLNLYPFTREAVHLIWRVSSTPGEIMVGCLYAFNRYHELRRELSRFGPETQDSLKRLITPSIASSSILQLSSYFRGPSSKDLPKLELSKLVLEDHFFQSTYVLSQEIASLKLSQTKVTTGLGSAFIGFLKILTRNSIVPISERETLVMTRGQMKFPKLPVFDCMFQYDLKLVGVLFADSTLENSLNIKIETAYRSLRAVTFTDADSRERIDHVHFVLIVCIESREENGRLADITHRLVYKPEKPWSFINAQDRDYRPRVAVVSIPDDFAWAWKVMWQPRTIFKGEDRDFLAFLMERVRVQFGNEDNHSVPDPLTSVKWQNLLDQIVNRYDVSKGEYSFSRQRAEGGWEP